MFLSQGRSISTGPSGIKNFCAEILKLHGSVLEIESEAGRGSRIGFVLPGREEVCGEG